MKRAISNMIFSIYLIIAILVTVCLLSYNDYKVSVFGSTSVLIVSDSSLSPEFDKGDIILVESAKKYSVGERIFYYEAYNDEIIINVGTISEIQTSTEEQYAIDNGEKIVSSKLVIGQGNQVKIIKHMGYVLEILESKWGFLFLIVLPALLAFVNQLIVVISGIKESKNKEAE